MKARLLLLVVLSLCNRLPADVLELKNGQCRPGKILQADEKFIRLEVEIPGQPAPAGQVAPSIAIPRGDVQAIDFSPAPDRDAAVRSAGVQDIPALEASWQKFSPWLSTPRSPSAAVACALGHALLATKEPHNGERALELFTLVEEKAWQDADKFRAREGRLRAMMATGQAARAMDEAKALAADSEDPEILIEANYLMAQASAKQLESFLKENPRWNIDPNVIDERHRLQNRVLELYLQPALFFGSEGSKAARGLWGAVEIYKLSAENERQAGLPDAAKSHADLAMETCRDIVTLYPETPEANLASTYLNALSPEQLAVNFEAQARKEIVENGNSVPPTPAPTPAESPATRKEPKTKRKKHEKK
ncbi:MAG: hypothetical protein WCG66_04665 [bacterium]